MRTAQLGDHVEILSGFAFKSDRFNDEGRGLPLVRIRDVKPATSTTYYDGDFDERFLLSDGDLLVGMDGEFNCARWAGGRALLNQRVCRVRSASKALNEQYLFWFLPKALKEIEEKSSFVTVKHLSGKQINEIEIPLPRLDEQKRIAAILDQADDLRRKRKQALNRLNQLGQAIFHEMFGDAARYDLLTLKVLGRVSTGSTPPTSEADSFGGPVPFVTPGDLGSGEPVKRSLSETGAMKSRTVSAGATMVCCIGATIGKMGLSTDRSAFNQQINAIEWNNKIDPFFGYFAVQQIRSLIIHKGKGASTTLPILKKSEFEKLEIICPPKAAQIDFSKRIAAVEANRASLEKALAIAAELFSSLQHRAFRGEL